MKAFIEEYGMVVVVSVVITALIGVGTFFGKTGTNSIKNIARNFCFVSGTQVTYDMAGHTKAIEDFEKGDDVVSYDRETETFYMAKVVDVVKHESEDEMSTTLAEVKFSNGAALNMTTDHEILTTEGGRSAVNEKHPERVLKVGDIAITVDGYSEVTSINIYDCEPTATYCLCVMDEDEIRARWDNDTNDNFLAEGVVVHNSPFDVVYSNYYRIGTTAYSSLQAAHAASNGAWIIALRNDSTSASYIMPAESVINLDTNGYNIATPTTEQGYHVETEWNNQKVTIRSIADENESDWLLSDYSFGS